MRFAARALAAGLVFALAAGFLAAAFEVEFDRGVWLPDNHPEQQKLDRLARDFSPGEVLVVAFDLGEDFFQPQLLDALRLLENDIEQSLDEDLLDTLSPLSAQHILDAGASLEIASYDELLQRGVIADIASYREIFAEGPYAGKLLSPSGRHAALRLRLDSKDRPEKRARLIALVKERLGASPLGAVAKLSGEPVIKERLHTMSEAGLPRLLALAAIILALFAAFILRQPSPVFCALASAFLAASACLAIMAATGHDINAIALLLPVMLAVIALADALHIAAHYRQTGDPARALMRAALPCFAASLTSAIGFGAFALSSLVPLQQFGQTAILAILAAFPLTMLVCFAGLGGGKKSAADVYHRLAGFAAALAAQRPVLVGAGLTGILLLLAAGLSTARTETNFLSVFFYPASDIRQDFAFVDENLGGSGGIDILVHARADAAFNRLAGFTAIQREQAELETLPDVRAAESYQLALGEAQRAFSGQTGQPSSEEELAQLLLFLEFSRSEKRDDILSPYVNFSYDTARLYLRLPDLSSRQLARRIEAIENRPAGFAAREITGFGGFIHALSEEVLATQLASFGLTLLLIAALFLLQFGLRLGILGVLANLLPVAALGGLIALLRIPFDFGTVLIGGITLGLAVDDAVHFLYAWRRAAIEQNLPRREALQQVLLLTGRPILLTSLVFCAGLAVLFVSPLIVLAKFAAFTMAGLMFAVLSCLVLLPAWLMAGGERQ